MTDRCIYTLTLLITYAPQPPTIHRSLTLKILSTIEKNNACWKALPSLIKNWRGFATSQPDHSTAVYLAIRSLLLALHHSYVPKNLPVGLSNVHTLIGLVNLKGDWEFYGWCSITPATHQETIFLLLPAQDWLVLPFVSHNSLQATIP